jgi:thiol:disulfide interchange protein DsbA
MTMKVMRRLMLVAGLALLAPATASAQFLWAEGTHFQRVGPMPAPDVPAGKIAVTEVFSYVCGGCYQVREEVEKLKAALPADAVLTYVHAGFNPGAGWPLFQRAFVTAQALGIAEKNHARMFTSLWETYEFPYIDAANRRVRQPLPTLADAARFYAKNGDVTEQAFLSKAASPEVNAAVKRAEELVKEWKVPSTPSFIVNGRYLVITSALNGWPQLSQLVNFLVAQERARLQAAQTK